MNSKVLQAIVEIAGSVSPTVEKAVKGTCEKLDKVNLKAVAVGAAATAGAVAVGKAAIEAGKYLANLGDEYNKSINNIAATTGATGKELEAFGNVLKDVYGDNFGESMDDVAISVSEIYRQTGLTDEALAETTKAAYALSDTFGYEVTESARAAKAMMTNFGVTGEEAMSLIAAGAQNGLDFSGELIDSINEYSVQFAKLGFSADDMFNIFQQGADSGAWNLDKVGDAIKEFSIRSIDGSKTTEHAFQALGLNADKMMKTFAAGGDGAAEAFQTVASKLVNMTDAVERDAIGVELFGTMWEDLGVDAVAAMADMQAHAYDTGDALAGIMDVKYNNIGDAFDAIKRKAEVSLLPLASTVANSVMAIMPIISDLFESVGPLIEDLTVTLTPLIQDTVAKIGPMLSEFVPPLLRVASTVAEKLIPPLAEIVLSVLPAIIQMAEMVLPLIEFIAADVLPALVGIIQTLLPEILKIIELVLPIAIDLLEQIFPVISNLISSVLPVVVSLLETLLPIISKLISELLPPVIGILTSIIPIVSQIIESVLPIVIQLLDVLMPILNQVLGFLSPILDLIVQLVVPILNLIMTAITPLINIIMSLINMVLVPLMPIIQFVAELFTNSLGAAISSIQPIITALTGVFSGLISFIQNIFAGNWSAAWRSVVQIFSNIWSGIVAMFKAPINFIIGGINSFLSSLNRIKIPDWVPGVGGYGLSIPLIPKLATGGFTDGISIAGEAGMEAVISFDPTYHDENVGYWERAGKLLGVLDDVNMNDGARAATAASLQMAQSESGAKEAPQITQAGKLMELDDFSLGQLTETTVIYYDFSGFSYAPQVDAGAATNKEDIVTALKEQASEFFDWLEEWLRQKEVGKYDRVSIY